MTFRDPAKAHPLQPEPHPKAPPVLQSFSAKIEDGFGAILVLCVQCSDTVLNLLVGLSFDTNGHLYRSYAGTMIMHYQHLIKLLLVLVLPSEKT